PTLSGDWPRWAMVRSIYQQILFLDPVDSDWPKIKVKTLILGGEVDTPDYAERSKHIAATIPGAEIAMLPGLGHVPHLQDPAAFYPPLLKFLKAGLTGASTGANQ